MKYLVIVESPSKIEKIQKFLNSISGHEFIVEASYGHIRYFKDGLNSIDVANRFNPEYAIIDSKKKVVQRLKAQLKKVDEVIIATDQDREGEAIGFHLIEALGLNPSTTKRICFNEITKPAIVNAFNESRNLDMNLVYSQQSRSILDLLIGFEISPLLWKYIQKSLSAGRCQSPALKLIYEKELEIENFTSMKSYTINANFDIMAMDILTTYDKSIDDYSIIRDKIDSLVNDKYKLVFDSKKVVSNNPPAPFITSTIQQEASVKFGMSPKNTMSILQKLYEKGKITYMRTDSTAISDVFVSNLKDYIDSNYGGYFKRNIYKSKVSNAQEAHECIRPVSLDYVLDDKYSSYEKKLFELIKKRVIASQMKRYSEEVYTYKLVNNKGDTFTFSFKKILTLGYKILYKNEEEIEDNSELISKIEDYLNKVYRPKLVKATETHTKPKSRYTEASLIKELEEKGIGRPSTFSNIVSTLLERNYVIKNTKDKEETKSIEILSVKPGGAIKVDKKDVKERSEKNKLFISGVGRLVCEFMDNHFSEITSYSYTSEIESELDEISNGNATWYKIVKKLYDSFHPKVIELKKKKSSLSVKSDKKKLLGINPVNNLNIYIYIGKYGPCIQEGDEEDEVRYISIDKQQDLNEITLDDALEYLKYPKLIGHYKNQEVYIKNGRYGKYVECGKTKIPIDRELSLRELIELIERRENNIIKEFSDGIKILRGPYGVYIKKGKNNYSIDKSINAEELTKKILSRNNKKSDRKS